MILLIESRAPRGPQEVPLNFQEVLGQKSLCTDSLAVFGVGVTLPFGSSLARTWRSCA